MNIYAESKSASQYFPVDKFFILDGTIRSHNFSRKKAPPPL